MHQESPSPRLESPEKQALRRKNLDEFCQAVLALASPTEAMQIDFTNADQDPFAAYEDALALAVSQAEKFKQPLIKLVNKLSIFDLGRVTLTINSGVTGALMLDAHNDLVLITGLETIVGEQTPKPQLSETYQVLTGKDAGREFSTLDRPLPNPLIVGLGTPAEA